MPQTIDVTGLAPEDIKAVVSLVETLRHKPAPGTSSPNGAVLPRDLPYEEWVKWFRAWVDSHPKRDIEIDDSRETIYAGRGE